jgi:hypothetical protein
VINNIHYKEQVTYHQRNGWECGKELITNMNCLSPLMDADSFKMKTALYVPPPPQKASFGVMNSNYLQCNIHVVLGMHSRLNQETGIKICMSNLTKQGTSFTTNYLHFLKALFKLKFKY